MNFKKSETSQEGTYLVLTGKGLRYGKNVPDPDNPGQTKPEYYVHMFPELLEMINAAIKEDDMSSLHIGKV